MEACVRPQPILANPWGAQGMLTCNRDGSFQLGQRPLGSGPVTSDGSVATQTACVMLGDAEIARQPHILCLWLGIVAGGGADRVQ